MLCVALALLFPGLSAGWRVVAWSVGGFSLELPWLWGNCLQEALRGRAQPGTVEAFDRTGACTLHGPVPPCSLVSGVPVAALAWVADVTWYADVVFKFLLIPRKKNHYLFMNYGQVVLKMC